ncbi:helix-turn-helix transcriptional regulator [Paramesorhizobium deserti]|uniref:helix-turn-helix transcriptional regulator n=1 Tax=Paramesorhizobium deserti TaxID=1494590 RepID=UPI00128FD627|nr:autoinducer binding domain-containing protein [Paramesorhizobium deserti]
MAMRGDSSSIGKIVELTDAATSEDDLRSIVEKIVELYGLRHVVYHGSRASDELATEPILLCTYEKNWIDRYLECHYFRIDPVVRFASERLLPIDWSELPHNTPAVKRFFGEAHEHGVGRNGMTIPIRGPCGERALFSITSDVSNRRWQRDRAHYARELQVFAHCFHNRAVVFHSANQDHSIAPLSPRERQCLQLLAQGRAPKQIAADLQISESAVRLYTSTACRKLKCKNRNHAISRATRLGLIHSL